MDDDYQAWQDEYEPNEIKVSDVDLIAAQDKLVPHIQRQDWYQRLCGALAGQIVMRRRER